MLVATSCSKNVLNSAIDIGIGSGPDCDGQILVTPDLLGMLPWYNLKHVKPKLNAAEQIRVVVREWSENVRTSKRG